MIPNISQQQYFPRSLSQLKITCLHSFSLFLSLPYLSTVKPVIPRISLSNQFKTHVIINHLFSLSLHSFFHFSQITHSFISHLLYPPSSLRSSLSKPSNKPSPQTATSPSPLSPSSGPVSPSLALRTPPRNSRAAKFQPPPCYVRHLLQPPLQTPLSFLHPHAPRPHPFISRTTPLFRCPQLSPPHAIPHPHAICNPFHTPRATSSDIIVATSLLYSRTTPASSPLPAPSPSAAKNRTAIAPSTAHLRFPLQRTRATSLQPQLARSPTPSANSPLIPLCKPHLTADLRLQAPLLSRTAPSGRSFHLDQPP